MTDPNHRKRILVVDDEDDITSVLKAFLDLYGYEVTIARDGTEALRYLRDGHPPPNLILLDLMMPVMNGWEFRQVQRADPALAQIPVVILSGGGNIRDHAAALEVPGALSKPADIDTLLETIQRHIR